MPEPKPHTTVTVSAIPNCDVCSTPMFGIGRTTPAYADAKLSTGQWANVCKSHFAQYSCKLGLGKGQKFIQS